jgi:hypothetical protein
MLLLKTMAYCMQLNEQQATQNTAGIEKQKAGRLREIKGLGTRQSSLFWGRRFDDIHRVLTVREPTVARYPWRSLNRQVPPAHVFLRDWPGEKRGEALFGFRVGQ